MLNADGALPATGFDPTHAAPVYRLTEAGWNVIKSTHAWFIATFAISAVALVVAVVAFGFDVLTFVTSVLLPNLPPRP